MAAKRSPILLATRSSGKLRELKEIFRDFDFDVVDLSAAGVEYNDAEEVIESYATFEENALAKGRYFHDLTGMPTLADDSGLVVDALGGAPGVFSKRFSGRNDLSGVALDDANNEKLLRELQRIGPVSRSARYMCIAAYVGAPGEMIRTGSIEGKVIDSPRGSGGF